MLELLHKRAERICADGVKLLGEFSGIHSEDVQIHLVTMSNHFWRDLPPDGKRIQTNLLPQIDRFCELIRSLSRNFPGSIQSDISYTLNNIKSAVEQDHSTDWDTNDEAVDGFRQLIDNIFKTLTEYCETSPDTFYVIPDTNALYDNTDIENWHFEDVKDFTIMLTPTILSELDNHKVNHKNKDIRNKAIKLIRKIKEYRRRGSLHEGVTIVKNKIALRSIAVEPDMSHSLSWFDNKNPDDRFLATTLEIIRDNIGSNVFIVTSDINMQNKAEFAGIPFCEVPDHINEQNSD